MYRVRKKQLIVSFVKHFTKNDENTICIAFQFYNQKLSQETCFIFSLLYGTISRVKEAYFLDHFKKIKI